jgi:uncharacterized Ntn-hydrolase superfamily protein
MSDKSQTDATGNAMNDLKAVGDAVGQVGQQARQAGGQALDHAQDVAQDAQARAASLTSEVKERAASMAQTQKDGLAERLEDVAHAVHSAGEQLKGHQDWAANLVERGADELTTLADTLRTNDLRGLMDNLQDLAKRQPALFTGATLAAGFALARVGRVAVAGALRAAPQGSEPSS